MLDWSYDLLSEAEQRLLRHLAIFSAPFSLEAASAVAGSGEAAPANVADGIVSLVAKSLVAAGPTGATTHFRLLETTRAYALARLTECGELNQLAQKHAEFYRGVIDGMRDEQETDLLVFAILGNVRAALEWCFGPDGDTQTGIGLAAAFAPAFATMAPMSERGRWSQQAILSLDDASRGGPDEMRLQASFALSSMHLHGQSEVARVAMSRSLEIAEARGDVRFQAHSLCQLSVFHLRCGDFNAALDYARRGRAAAENGDGAAMAYAGSIYGLSLCFSGDHHAAAAELEAPLQYWSRSTTTNKNFLGLNARHSADIAMAKILWLRGHPVQAI